MGRALVLNHPPAAVSSASAEKYDASCWGLVGGLDIRRDSSVLVFGFWGDVNNVPPPTLWLRTLRTTTSHAQARPHGGVPGSWGGRPPPAADGMTVPVRRAAVPGKDVCPPHTSMSYINPRNAGGNSTFCSIQQRVFVGVYPKEVSRSTRRRLPRAVTSCRAISAVSMQSPALLRKGKARHCLLGL